MPPLQVKVIITHRDKYTFEIEKWVHENPQATIEHVSSSLALVTIVTTIFYRGPVPRKGLIA